MKAFRLAVIAIGCAVLSASQVRADDAPHSQQITRIDLYPPNIHLHSQRDRQTFIVVATRADGVTMDVTAEAKPVVAQAELVRLEGNVVYPAANGETTLKVELHGHTVEIPIVVQGAEEKPPVSFHLDVMPVFMRTGCNTGGCHGAARGKDGFRLSLFGYDPAGDYHRLTREIGIRRLNLAVPEASLLIEKSIGAVPHTGGKRFDSESEYYATLIEWLETGAANDASEPPKCVEVEFYPPAAVLEGEGTTQQFIARARYSDGTDRDVSHLAVFLTNNDNSAPINDYGRVTAANRGEAFVMARFNTHTVGSQVLVLPAGEAYAPQAVQGNYIDEFVEAKLQRLRMHPSELCGDEEFLRRVTIDIVGLLPTEEEYAAFLADESPDKRAKLIDRLLERKEFSEIWAMKWAELLMIKSGNANNVSYKSAFLYYNWLSDKIGRNVPLDEMVQELLTASGGTFTDPATNFYQIERDTLKTSENVAQIFMGIRTQCAQCHNHPFDRWTMDDYYGFAAFFSQIGRKEGEDYREQIVFNRRGGDVRHPVDNRVMAPKFLGGETPDLQGRDRREVLAEWLTSQENPYFATSVANRVVDHFFGLGIVEPVDDVRVSNPASNPQLLEALGDKLIEYNYDFKRLVRDICNSQAYQRSVKANASNAHDDKNFARAAIRRMQAEMLLDCISQVTETKDKFRGLPLGARAVQIADGATGNYFLQTFGRAERASACACEVKNEPTLSQALHLLNGDTVHNKIRNGGLVKKWLDEGLTPEQIVERIFVRALSRKPTEAEVSRLVEETVKTAANPREGLEDVFWAVLNSPEFAFNH